jgi:hypothetical protein
MTGQTFRYWRAWREVDVNGQLANFAQLHEFTSIGQARDSHTDSCRWVWVEPRMQDAHVSPLKVFKWGRELPDELAGKADQPVQRELEDSA